MSNTCIIILIILLFSFFLSTAKYAFQLSNKLILELEKNKKNLTFKILNIFYKYSDRYFYTIIIGKSLSVLIYAYLSIEILISGLQNNITNYTLLFITSVVIAVLIWLFVVELLPKILIRLNPNLFLIIIAIPFYIVYLLIYPISALISIIGTLSLKLLGINHLNINSESKALGKEELDQFIQDTLDNTPENTELNKEVQLFQNALEFSNVKIKDCIVPRTEIAAIEKGADLKDLINLFVKTGFSKIIVYEDDLDNIIGYIHSSELFSQPNDWTKSIYPIPFVPENMLGSKLMKNMLAENKSIVVVIDEFGGTVGIITLEDLVEEIFGEIEDEHDTQMLVSRKVNDTEYILSGRLEIDNINDEFDLDIPKSDEYMTLAGFILHNFQDFPKVNETITIDKYEIKILRVTQTKIELVKLKCI
ncbi:CBS domain containing-hemolysin-like protein [Dysgonomonadaceae bacterium PH5-43]|nr:CBS domain containing-hemolysin-like protein [Dysgonomonadaceae bacterium PH5-43]